MILGTLEILAEAYTLAEKSGIDSENVHSLVKGEIHFLFLLLPQLTSTLCRNSPRTWVS